MKMLSRTDLTDKIIKHELARVLGRISTLETPEAEAKLKVTLRVLGTDCELMGGLEGSGVKVSAEFEKSVLSLSLDEFSTRYISPLARALCGETGLLLPKRRQMKPNHPNPESK